MIYLYSRASTSKQDNSIDLQDKLLKDFYNRKFGGEPFVALVDNAVSGGKMILVRPAGEKLKHLVKGDIIICTKHDRLFRNFINAINMVDKWINMGVDIYFISVSETPISIKNPTNEFQFIITMAAAHYEKRMIGLRTKEGMKNRKDNDKTYAPPSYGYDNIDGARVENESEQFVIKQMAAYKKIGLSDAKIAAELNKNKVPTKKGGQWKMGTVNKILKNFV